MGVVGEQLPPPEILNDAPSVAYYRKKEEIYQHLELSKKESCFQNCMGNIVLKEISVLIKSLTPRIHFETQQKHSSLMIYFVMKHCLRFQVISKEWKKSVGNHFYNGRHLNFPGIVGALCCGFLRHPYSSTLH